MTIYAVPVFCQFSRQSTNHRQPTVQIFVQIPPIAFTSSMT